MEQRPGRPQASKYACKLCRRVLFEAEDLMDHVPERHQIAMRRKIKDSKHNGALNMGPQVDNCSSYFLSETLPWMDDAFLAEGKIHCPNAKCQSRLGSFQWSGSQCSCGTWVTPSIKLTKSRVDPVLAATNVHIITGLVMPDAASAAASAAPVVSASESTTTETVEQEQVVNSE